MPAVRPKADIEQIAKETGLNKQILFEETRNTVSYFDERIMPLANHACTFRYFAEACAGSVRPKLLRAYLLFTSRNWTIPWKDGDASLMAPIADMVNMGPPDTVYVSHVPHFYQGRGGFRMYAEASYKKGDEIEFYYGPECKERLYSLYGFTSKYAVSCPHEGPGNVPTPLEGDW